jgi:hypothetical protein
MTAETTGTCQSEVRGGVRCGGFLVRVNLESQGRHAVVAECRKCFERYFFWRNRWRPLRPGERPWAS